MEIERTLFSSLVTSPVIGGAVELLKVCGGLTVGGLTAETGGLALAVVMLSEKLREILHCVEDSPPSGNAGPGVMLSLE